MLNVIFTKRAQEDYHYFSKTKPTVRQRIDQLIQAIQLDPFHGIGKPETLRFNLSGYWSRRIDKEHRLVYKVYEDTLYIVQCRYHY